MLTPPIKGNFIKKPIKPELSGSELVRSISSISGAVSELTQTKNQIIGVLNNKLKEVDNVVQAHLDNLTNTNQILENTKTEAINLIREIKQGEPGTPADEQKITAYLESKIPKIDTEQLKKDILAEIPKIDEKSLTRKVLKAIPENKASLKIIQEKFEIDPMSVIEKIMSLPEGKFKLKSSQIDGLQQTMDAFRSQLGRGYLHGGGDTVVAGTNITIVTNAQGQKVISSSGGSGGITQINTDSTAHQLLVVGTSGTDFAIVDNGTGTHTFNLPTASHTNRGALSSADWDTFNGKQNALTIGNLTDAGTDGITVTGGTGAVIGSGTSLSQHVADSTHNGYLNSTDWTTFNNKGSGTVTAVSIATANGFSGSSSGGATPALTIVAGAITPTSVNSVVLSGSSTPTLAVTGTTTVSGANTGDQNLFSSIVVSGQTTVTANTTTTALTLVAGTNITLTTDNTGKSITINSTASGSGTVTSVASADGSITVTNPTTTVDLAVVKAPKLSTARTIGGVSFDGTANITVATATGGFTVSGGDLALGANNLTLTGSIGSTGSRVLKGWFTDLQVTNAISGSVTGNAGTVTNATFTTALTVNTGTLTLTANAANTSVLTVGAGAVSVSGSNTGDQNLFSSVPVSGQTTVTANSTTTALTFIAGSNVTITTDNTAKSITIASSGGGGGITWSTVSGTSQSGATNHGYITNNAGLVTVSLPTTAAVGDTFVVMGQGAGGWKVSQASGQQIHFGNQNTTSGASGSLASTNQYDTVTVICIVANNEFTVQSSIGNQTIV